MASKEHCSIKIYGIAINVSTTFNICVKWRSIMHLTYICQFLCVCTPPHLPAHLKYPFTHPYSQPRLAPPNHANTRISPGRVLRLLKLFCEVKAHLWFPPSSRHFAHIPPKSLHRLDIVGILHNPMLNPFRFMIFHQDTHLPTGIHNPGLTTTQPYQSHSSSNICLIYQSQNCTE